MASDLQHLFAAVLKTRRVFMPLITDLETNPIPVGVFKRLVIDQRRRDWHNALSIFADALEEQGKEALARAYRYARSKDLWPFTRTHYTNLSLTPFRSKGRLIYDWDVEGRKLEPLNGFAPSYAWLPVRLYNLIKRLPDRRYGGVSRAFVLLARGLQAWKRADGPIEEGK